jgi:hypothetical protein
MECSSNLSSYRAVYINDRQFYSNYAFQESN